MTASIRVATAVTHALFSPCSPHVFVGGRRTPFIWGYDTRNLSRPLLRLEREATTNQRMYFDISACGQFLFSADQGGGLRAYNLWSCASNDGPDVTVRDAAYAVGEKRLFPNLHTTATNGVSAHPFLPLLATASGKRILAAPPLPAATDDDWGCANHAMCSEDGQSPQPDNCLKLWRTTIS